MSSDVEVAGTCDDRLQRFRLPEQPPDTHLNEVSGESATVSVVPSRRTDASNSKRASMNERSCRPLTFAPDCARGDTTVASSARKCVALGKFGYRPAGPRSVVAHVRANR